jgi:ABC-type antimicrobial peptide transport system permease subunit
MIGLTKFGLIQIVIINALLCSVPAVIIGTIFGQLLYVLLSYILSIVLEVELSLWMTPIAFFMSILFGLLIPIVSAILPIKNALSLNLQESLDVNRYINL